MKKIEFVSFLACMLLLASPACQHIRELSLRAPVPVKVFITNPPENTVQAGITSNRLNVNK